jgi:uncharacterized protein with NRDE domain
MCLILLSYRNHPSFRLILAANRDEFYDRPTAPLGFREEVPHVLAGKDLKSGGTWLGVTKTGRICAITNFRDPKKQLNDAPSRGFLVKNFLKGSEPAENYLKKVRKDGHEYNGFNLLAGDETGLFCFSNRSDKISELSPGVHGLSNHLLDTPWPKVEKGKKAFKNIISETTVDTESIFAMLADSEKPRDAELPETGVGIEWERILSPLFIRSEIYGTRSSSIVLMSEKSVTFIERTYNTGGTVETKYETREFSFDLIG